MAEALFAGSPSEAMVSSVILSSTKGAPPPLITMFGRNLKRPRFSQSLPKGRVSMVQRIKGCHLPLDHKVLLRPHFFHPLLSDHLPNSVLHSNQAFLRHDKEWEPILEI